MTIQWQDIQLQANAPSFRPIQQVQIPVERAVERVPVSVEQNPYFNRGFQQEVTPMSNTSFGQPNAVKPIVNTGSSMPNDYTNAFINVAADTARGLTYSQGKRTQRGYADCSSLTARALNNYGIKVNPNMTTVSMPKDMKAAGFEMMAIDPNNLQVGDILWKNGHTAIYAGNGKTIEARGEGKPVGEYSLFGKSGKMTIPYTHIFRRSWS